MQGTHYFLNINSGRWVARNHWTALPMPNEVKQTIHRLTGANKKHKGIVFTDKNGNIINDNSPKEPNNKEITVVSTGVGDVGNTEINNNNNNTASTGTTNSTHVDEEIITQENKAPRYVKHTAHTIMNRRPMKN